MNINELRALLFGINNESLTVKDLRALLFDIEDQTEEVTAEIINQADLTS